MPTQSQTPPPSARPMTFNLRSTLGRSDAEAPLPTALRYDDVATPEQRQRHWWVACTSFGVVFAAALYDSYRRGLRAVLAADRVEAFMLVVLLLDWALRALLIIVASARVYFFFGDDPTAIELGTFGQAYVGIVICSLVFYCGERLVGRCGTTAGTETGAKGSPQPSADDVDFVTLWQVCNRAPMGWATGALVTAINLGFAAVVATAVMAAASELERAHEVYAYLMLVHVLAADVVYSFSRLRTFHEVADQSFVAANVAGVHTLYTICVVAPFSVAYLVHIN